MNRKLEKPTLVQSPDWSKWAACRTVQNTGGFAPGDLIGMTSTKPYPRDMIGYGRTPPFADWPSKARIAVQFVINYEEGGENNILHGDAASGGVPVRDRRRSAVARHAAHEYEIGAEYGSRAGFWRLHRMFTERSVPVTVYGVATAMARNSEVVAAMNEAGWELATHGYKWIDYRDAPPELEAEHIAEAVRIHTEVAGARPLGFYQGRSSINTIRLGMEEGGFLYCADAYADDLPYWLEGPRGPQLITPYTLDSTICVSRRRRVSIPETSSTRISKTVRHPL